MFGCDFFLFANKQNVPNNAQLQPLCSNYALSGKYIKYYGLQTMECSVSQGSDKVVIVICKLASNSIRKQRALRQLIKSATLNSLTTVSQQDATHATVTPAYQASI